MPDELKLFEDKIKNGSEWHLTFPYNPALPYPFPIAPVGTRGKLEPVGHLSSDGTVHVFNAEIIEQLVRAGLRASAPKNETGPGGGDNEK